MLLNSQVLQKQSNEYDAGMASYSEVPQNVAVKQ